MSSLLQHRRGHAPTTPLLSQIEDVTKRRRRTKPPSRRLNLAKFVISLLILIFMVIKLVLFYILDEYGWAHWRCLKASILWWNTVAAVECVEAHTHELAYKEQSLWNKINSPVSFRPQPVEHVHYTLTTLLTNQVFTLFLCSLETMVSYCQDADCVIHVWLVNEAGMHKTLLKDIQGTLQDSHHCIHVDIQGNEQLFGSTCGEPLCGVAQDLRQWLATDPPQLPAHTSDAWRLVALFEYGGLYLDADVLPLSPKLLYLPSPSIPLQNNVGAYRLNGGVLCMACGNDFVRAMIDDHLYWAPRLAKLPLSKQTFGFLGPCALTRVHVGRPSNFTTNILPVSIVEGAPSLSDAQCQSSSDRLALHFSGRRKTKWKELIHNCVEVKVKQSCPRVVQTYYPQPS
jgi:hypothetical protein